MAYKSERTKQISEIFKEIGRQRIGESLDIGATAISNAVVDGSLPPSWFPTVRRLGIEAGIEVPERLFSWRKPEDAEASEAAQ